MWLIFQTSVILCNKWRLLSKNHLLTWRCGKKQRRNTEEESCQCTFWPSDAYPLGFLTSRTPKETTLNSLFFRSSLQWASPFNAHCTGEKNLKSRVLNHQHIWWVSSNYFSFSRYNVMRRDDFTLLLPNKRPKRKYKSLGGWGGRSSLIRENATTLLILWQKTKNPSGPPTRTKRRRLGPQFQSTPTAY